MSECALATIFTIPKPFDGHVGVIQRNAVASWKALTPEMDIWLMGDEAGVGDFAGQAEVNHWPDLRRNEFGTPLLSSAFRAAHKVSASPVLIYCNADVILTDDFARAVERLVDQDMWRHFLAIGQRIDVDIREELDFESMETIDRLGHWVRRGGKRASIACKEYFVFPHGLFESIPDFAVGRGNWDNWMVHQAKRMDVPVVSLTPVAPVIHQMHGYQHVRGSRMASYVTGPEARKNQQLAGGRHLISGSTSNWEMTADQIRAKRRVGFLDRDVWHDFPRFFKLLLNLGLNR